MDNVKEQCETGQSRSKAGFEVNPQNINREGAPPKELTYRELIKQVGEQQSKLDALKKRKVIAVEAQWDKAEKGDTKAFKELMDRVDGKPPQAIGSYGKDGELELQNFGYIYLPEKKPEGHGT